MRRRLLNLLTAVSLLLCVAVVAVWVRSFFVSDIVCYQGNNSRELLVETGKGSISITAGRYPGEGEEGFGGWWWAKHDAVNPAFRFAGRVTPANRWGFHWSTDGNRRPDGSRYQRWTVASALWVPAALLALLPSTRYIRARRQHTAGLCPACGYDLRASPGRCPECGAQATQPTGSPSTSPRTTLLPRP